ncbi:MAG: hypothetical protein ABR509_00140 [Candidatus Limnocylindria bacterium]
MDLYFYELHEDSDLTTDAILVSEQLHTAEAFEAMVRAARDALLETFEEDTLVEAVARQLEREHGLTYVSDERLQASMSVGIEEDATYLVEGSREFRSLVVDLER